jgi:hypothetical protein
MVKPVFRRKSIGTKVSEEEYARLEALAEGRAMSEWAREVLLRELDGRQARPAVLFKFLSHVASRHSRLQCICGRDRFTDGVVTRRGLLTCPLTRTDRDRSHRQQYRK